MSDMDHRTTEAPEHRSGHPDADDATSRIRVRRLDTQLRNKWEAQVDKRPVGRAATSIGAINIARAHLESQS